MADAQAGGCFVVCGGRVGDDGRAERRGCVDACLCAWVGACLCVVALKVEEQKGGVCKVCRWRGEMRGALKGAGGTETARGS